MQSISSSYQDKYPGVDPDFIDTVNVFVKKNKVEIINFIDTESQLNGYTGKISDLKNQSNGLFVKLEAQNVLLIRLDKIVTIGGKPGPSYEAYDLMGNTCLTCEDPDNFKFIQ